MSAIKKATIFDFLAGITEKKIPWEDWSEIDQKAFSPFMVTRWLSMNSELLEFVNDLQEYTSRLDKREVYKLYFNILPKMKFYYKYVKRTDYVKFDPDLVKYVKLYFTVCEREAIEYIELFKKYDTENIELIEILSKFGLEEKKIKKMIKNRKK